MKTKKWCLLGLSLIFLMVMSVCTASADTYYSCQIGEVANDYVVLTDTAGSFTDQWFVFENSSSSKMMAVTLTAMSLGKNVNIWVQGDDFTPTYPVITFISVINQ